MRSDTNRKHKPGVMIKTVLSYVVRTCLVAVVLMTTQSTFAQYVFFDKPTFELGLNFGPSNFLGDLGGTQGKGRGFLKDNNFKMTNFAKGLYFTVRPSEFIGFTLSANFSKLEGADSIIKAKGGLEEARKQRNLHFRSNLREFTLTAEVYPFVFLEANDKDLYRKLRPYGVIGVGFFRFNPQAQYVTPTGGRQWVDLQPLRTEGQGMPGYPNNKPYSLNEINIPYGAGVKYYFSEKFSVGLEITTRKTFTDYIDDVSTRFVSDADFDNFFGAGSSNATIAKQVHNRAQQVAPGVRIPAYNAGDQRGTTTNNDSYYFTTIKLGLRLGRSDGATRQTRCPIVF